MLPDGDSSERASTFVTLLESIILEAGSIDALARQAGVRREILQRWRRGDHPTERVTNPVELVNAWAARTMGGRYPPPGYPADGLVGFIGSARVDGATKDAATSEQLDPVLPRSFRRRAVSIAAAVALVGVAGALVVATRPDRGEPVVVVQNMIAIGADALLEDATPSYLSAEPVARCAARGCKIAGSEMFSGYELVVECTVRSEWPLTNADLGSPGIDRNPHAVSSDLWYRARRTDGLVGFLPEIYLGPRYRGGLGLSPC